MQNLNFAPLFRSSVGFDRMLDLLDSAARHDSATPSYPPYNIEKLSDAEGGEKYRITLAVAGFRPEELDIETKEGQLLISGRKVEQKEPAGAASQFLHRGIASRAFERTFRLAEHVVVHGAHLEHGLLHVDLVRELPEAMKPRRIAIETATGTETPKGAVLDAA